MVIPLDFECVCVLAPLRIDCEANGSPTPSGDRFWRIRPFDQRYLPNHDSTLTERALTQLTRRPFLVHAFHSLFLSIIFRLSFSSRANCGHWHQTPAVDRRSRWVCDRARCGRREEEKACVSERRYDISSRTVAVCFVLSVNARNVLSIESRSAVDR